MTSITDYGVAFPRFMSKESIAICSAVSLRRRYSNVHFTRLIDCFNFIRILTINHADTRVVVYSDS